MRERPIPFSGDMVRAVLAGTKTQTRRICKPAANLSHVVAVQDPDEQPLGQRPPYFTPGWFGDEDGEVQFFSPYGAPGDRLWVREAWRSTSDLDQYSGSQIADLCLNAGYRKPWAPLQYEADGERREWKHTSTPPHDGPPMAGRYRHGRFMPRWASRILLEVTAVRVERLQDISEDDAIAEGIDGPLCAAAVGTAPYKHKLLPAAIHGYSALWERLNGPGSWHANPWLWVIEFRRIA